MAKIEKTERARAELVKPAAGNCMYFVIRRGHFGDGGYRFAGMRNSRRLKPEIYLTTSESFYDLTVGDDELFEFKIDMAGRKSFPWTRILRDVAPHAVKSIVKTLG